MTSCLHEDCGASEKVWLQSSYCGRERGLRPHLYCIKCGLIKNQSSPRPQNIGYFINILTRLTNEFKVTKIQIRLASKELERCGIEDCYGLDRHQQEKLFIQIVKKYIKVEDEDILKLFIK